MSERGLYRARFLAVVLIPGAVLMALEIVSSRLLAPQFGNSVYVWGSIIGVFLAAMSAGYVAGGRAADRWPRLETLGVLLLVAAYCQWATQWVGRPAVAALGSWSGGHPAGTLLATALLFAPATLFLATVAPFALRVAARQPERLGGLAGRIYALSTFGSLAGTLAATFVLVPRLPLDAIFALLVSASALAAALAAGRRRRVLLGLAALAAVLPWLGPRPLSVGSSVLAERISPYQTLVVRERGGLRTLESDGTRHGALEVATGAPALSYLAGAQAAWLFQPETKSVLVLGLGSGGLGAYLRERFPAVDVTYVEIDPAVPELARRWFGFVPGPGLSLVIDDGRRYLARSDRRFDHIYCDTYVGLSVPFHLATREFFLEAAARLEPGGTLGVNLASALEHPFARAILRTMRQVFPQVLVFRIAGSGNLLLLGVEERGPVASSMLAARGRALDRRFDVEPRFEEVASWRRELDLDLSDVPILTDAYAPVDALLNFAETAPPAGFPDGSVGVAPDAANGGAER